MATSSRSLLAGRGSRNDATRRHNLSAILTAVHHSGPLSRAALTRRTTLNRSTVGALVAELVELGLVYESAPEEQATRGRPSPLVHPQPNVVALVVNPDMDAITIGLVGLGGVVHKRIRYETDKPPSVAETVKIVSAIVEGMRTELDSVYTVVGVTVVIPGLVRIDDERVIRAPHLDWSNENIAKMLSDVLGYPGLARNDARASVVAETVFGAGRGVQNLVYLYGSRSGIGGGAVVDGATLRGDEGFGAELGHTLVSNSSKTCHCGRKGCLETEVNMPGLLDVLGIESLDLDELDDVLAKSTDPLVQREVRRQLDVLAEAIANFVSVFNPESVILSGFLGSLYTTDPKYIEQRVKETSYRPLADNMRVERAQLGSRVLLVGGAEVAFLSLLRNPASHASLTALAEPGEGLEE